MTPETWFITGASAGFGAAFAEHALAQGHNVVAAARRAERLERLAAKAPGRVLALTLDVTDTAAAADAVARAEARFGGIDVLVNNAGYGVVGAVEETPEAEFRAQMETHFFGALALTQAVLPGMRGCGRGAIVNNASVLGWRAQEGQAHYAAAKAAVMAFTRCVAVEAAEAGVRVNAVAPSLAMHAFLSKVTPPGLLEALQAREAFGRAAEPFEVANVMVFLASDYASYMTGEVVAVSSQHP